MSNMNWKVTIYDKDDKVIDTLSLTNKSEIDAYRRAGLLIKAFFASDTADWTMKPIKLKRSPYHG